MDVISGGASPRKTVAPLVTLILESEKVKAMARQRLGQGISKLVSGGNVRNMEQTTSNTIPNKLKINFDIYLCGGQSSNLQFN
ncbi:unnamed protein product [Prunus armeniaca]|uniref:Uncharacterized protein n=1 Tax=Prunus armeniaca TaxID=36596 RepID=A0A6J5XYR9_PRUAR|nr:unnamed protein product [Prunus armeniaca]CAB4318341.1 unnamed protein product [Prunus armeniaca]